MGNVKISELTELTEITNDAYFAIVEGSTTKKVQFQTFDLLPIGSIIPIHPEIDVSKAIDTNHWALCDNTGDSLTITYHDGTTDSINRPDLSDDRFLMGDNVAVATTGGNNSSAHTHGTDDPGNHLHQWYDYAGASGANNGIATFGGQANNKIYNSGGSAVSVGTNVGQDAYTTNAGAHTHTTNSQSASENRPLYFSVLYYMRIK